ENSKRSPRRSLIRVFFASALSIAPPLLAPSWYAPQRCRDATTAAQARRQVFSTKLGQLARPKSLGPLPRASLGRGRQRGCAGVVPGEQRSCEGRGPSGRSGRRGGGAGHRSRRFLFGREAASFLPS